jgi:hypothetical protein
VPDQQGIFVPQQYLRQTLQSVLADGIIHALSYTQVIMFTAQNQLWRRTLSGIGGSFMAKGE